MDPLDSQEQSWAFWKVCAFSAWPSCPQLWMILVESSESPYLNYYANPIMPLSPTTSNSFRPAVRTEERKSWNPSLRPRVERECSCDGSVP